MARRGDGEDAAACRPGHAFGDAFAEEETVGFSFGAVCGSEPARRPRTATKQSLEAYEADIRDPRLLQSFEPSMLLDADPEAWRCQLQGDVEFPPRAPGPADASAPGFALTDIGPEDSAMTLGGMPGDEADLGADAGAMRRSGLAEDARFLEAASDACMVTLDLSDLVSFPGLEVVGMAGHLAADEAEDEAAGMGAAMDDAADSDDGYFDISLALTPVRDDTDGVDTFMDVHPLSDLLGDDAAGLVFAGSADPILGEPYRIARKPCAQEDLELAIQALEATAAAEEPLASASAVTGAFLSPSMVAAPGDASAAFGSSLSERQPIWAPRATAPPSARRASWETTEPSRASPDGDAPEPMKSPLVLVSGNCYRYREWVLRILQAHFLKVFEAKERGDLRAVARLRATLPPQIVGEALLSKRQVGTWMQNTYKRVVDKVRKDPQAAEDDFEVGIREIISANATPSCSPMRCTRATRGVCRQRTAVVEDEAAAPHPTPIGEDDTDLDRKPAKRQRS